MLVGCCATVGRACCRGTRLLMGGTITTTPSPSRVLEAWKRDCSTFQLSPPARNSSPPSFRALDLQVWEMPAELKRLRGLAKEDESDDAAR